MKIIEQVPDPRAMRRIGSHQVIGQVGRIEVDRQRIADIIRRGHLHAAEGQRPTICRARAGSVPARSQALGRTVDEKPILLGRNERRIWIPFLARLRKCEPPIHCFAGAGNLVTVLSFAWYRAMQYAGFKAISDREDAVHYHHVAADSTAGQEPGLRFALLFPPEAPVRELGLGGRRSLEKGRWFWFLWVHLERDDEVTQQ